VISDLQSAISDLQSAIGDWVVYGFGVTGVSLGDGVLVKVAVGEGVKVKVAGRSKGGS